MPLRSRSLKAFRCLLTTSWVEVMAWPSVAGSGRPHGASRSLRESFTREHHGDRTLRGYGRASERDDRESGAGAGATIIPISSLRRLTSLAYAAPDVRAEDDLSRHGAEPRPLELHERGGRPGREARLELRQLRPVPVVRDDDEDRVGMGLFEDHADRGRLRIGEVAPGDGMVEQVPGSDDEKGLPVTGQHLPFDDSREIAVPAVQERLDLLRPPDLLPVDGGISREDAKPALPREESIDFTHGVQQLPALPRVASAGLRRVAPDELQPLDRHRLSGRVCRLSVRESIPSAGVGSRDLAGHATRRGG